MTVSQAFSLRHLCLLVGVGALLALTEINARLIGLFPAEVHQSVQVALLMAGIIGIVFGFVGFPAYRRLHHKEVWLLFLITVFALVLRIWQLDTAVSVPLADEYVFIDTAIALWDKPDFPLLEPFDDGFAFTWTYPHIILVSMETFGWGVFAARLPGAIIGTMTVIACYFLSKHLYNQRIAFMSALILASFPPHVHISRMALTNVFDPFFGTLAFALLVTGFQKHHAKYLVISGVLLGLTQYFHEAGRLLFPLSALLWVFMADFGDVTKQRVHLIGQRIFYVFVPFLLIAFPVYITLIALDYPLFSRMEWTSPGGARNDYVLERTDPRNILSENYVERLGGVLLHFVHRLDNSPDFYGGNQPMVLYAISPLFLVGVFSLFWHIRKRRNQQLLIWLALAIFGIALIRIGAWTIRFAPIFPAIAIVIALGIGFISERLPERIKRSVWVLLVCFVVAVQVSYYFGSHLDTYNRQVRWQSDFADAFHRVIDLPLNTTVNFIDEEGVWTAYIQILMRLWKRTDIQVVHYPVDEFKIEDAEALVTDGLAQVFFVHPDDAETVHMLEQVFHLSGPAFSPYTDVPDDLQYALYYVTNP